MKKNILKILCLTSLVGLLASCGGSEKVSTTTVSPTTTTAIPSTTITTNTTTSTTTTIPPTTTDSTDQSNLGWNTGTVLDNGQLDNLVVAGSYEGASASWTKALNTTYKAYYKKASENSYTLADSFLIREVSTNVMRLDLLGLQKNTNYDIKIVPVLNGKEMESSKASLEVQTLAYDRSGYAHFNYTEGVGAYNDDGTLKEDALVIYVTDSNKDNVVADNTCLLPYTFNIPGSDWGNKEALGIGWYLNNAQYTKAVKDSSGNVIASKSSNTYSAMGSTLGLIEANKEHPICIRFIGTVTAPEGLTAYDSLNEGGTDGDNGCMARMKNYKNITIEGVGNDAIIDGWGFHFMCSDSTIGGYSFEARNLTFKNYPEDAIGMEGVQEGSTITAPVSNCWVHHNTFLPGYCQNPAESDKAEGDGSCDFKRGMYYTMSYNYYENCHKTNLVGSSDSSLQYNISFHHNVWYNCESRIPLLRQANIHFYNNYIYGDINNADLSYVTSLRANCYMYSEYNYYEGCKNVFDSSNSGGVCKAYGNTYLACFKNVDATLASTREEKISSSCKYLTTDFTNFDTNSSLFYYDTVNKRSNCYLTDSVTARYECILYAGSMYRTIGNNTDLKINSTNVNQNTPTSAVDLSVGSYEAVLPTSKTATVINNIMYTNLTGASSGTIKFKGQGVTFTLTSKTEVTLAMSANQENYGIGYLVGSDGTIYLSSSGTCILDEGTYFIQSIVNNSETTLSKISFTVVDLNELSKKKIESANEAINALPDTILYNSDTMALIVKAKALVEALTETEKESVDVSSYEAKLNTFNQLGKAYVEGLISSIGTVSSDSLDAITLAKNEYDTITSYDSSIEIANIDTLNEAIATFETYKVNACINTIDAIGTVTLNSEADILKASAAYSSLTETQKASVTNYSKLEEAIERLEDLKEMQTVKNLYDSIDLTVLESLALFVDKYEVLDSRLKDEINLEISNIYVQYVILSIDSIGEVTLDDKALITKIDTIYNELTEAEKSLVTNYSNFTAAKEALASLQSATQECIFDGVTKTYSNDFFTIYRTGNRVLGYKTDRSISYNGVLYTNALKMESGIQIEFATTTTTTLTLVGDGASKEIEIDGTKYTFDSTGVLTVELRAGNHVIEKDDSMNIAYICVSPK